MKKRTSIILSLLVSLMFVRMIVFGTSLETPILYPAQYSTSSGNYYGYINDQGEWVVQPIYEYAFPFSDGVAVVSDGKLYGVINSKGKEVVPITYQSISPYKEGRAIVVNQDGIGVMDTKGKTITKKSYNYIQEYSDGVAVVSSREGGKDLYGYINKYGNEVIPPKYLSASDFQNGKALVQLEEGKFALINKEDETLGVYAYPYVYGYSDGRLIYKDAVSGKYGYLDEQGNVVVHAKYESAEVFKDGVAVVSTSPYLIGEKGLIDTEGNEIYPNIYNDILNLGENRVALGRAIDVKEPLKGSLYAIADIKGEALTDFVFYGVSNYDKERASVYDATDTYFVDKTGRQISSFPKITGSGTLEQIGDVIRGDIDYSIIYFLDSGQIIYKPNDNIELSDGRVVRRDFYKPTLNYAVYYPQVIGLSDEGVESRINDKLRVQAMHDDVTAQEALEYTYYSNFSIPFYKDQLLVTDVMQSTYYLGAAHPLPGRIFNMINLEKGTFYELKDLFKADSNWKEELNGILAKMSKEEPIASQIYSDQEKVVVEDNQGFYVDGDNLYLYYPPYDVGPYASGYITYKIPYTEIMNIIDPEGAFWKSYHE